MIKMIKKVAYELIPFVFLFLFAAAMFCFVFGCLNMPYGDDYSCIGLNGSDFSFYVEPLKEWYSNTTCNDIRDRLISSLP